MAAGENPAKANDELKMYIRRGASLTQPRTTARALAKNIVENKTGPLQIDASIQQLFPDFGQFFVSERESVVLDFVKQYLPECQLNVEISSNQVTVIRHERIPGVGLYPHIIGHARVKDNLPASILAASLFAYDYLFS